MKGLEQEQVKLDRSDAEAVLKMSSIVAWIMPTILEVT